jgi:hypothetical protein
MEILLYLFKSSLLLLIFLLCYRFLLAKETFYAFNRYFLSVGVVSALFLPSIIFTRKVSAVPLDFSQLSLAEMANPEAMSATQTSAFDIWEIALLVYGVGALIFSTYFLYQLISLLVFLKKQDFYTENGLIYVEISGVSAPFSFFKYIVYDPQAHTAQELQMILQHERAHATQLHSLDILLGRFCCIALWFNPFCWIYFRATEENLEFLADSCVEDNLFSSKSYQLTLLKNATGTKVPQFAQSFYKSFIKKRITMLNTTQSQNRNRYKVLVLLPFLAAFLWSFNVREVKITSGERQKLPISTEKSVEMTENLKDKAFRFEIASNTTETEMEALAAQLKEDYNVQLKYSGLTYDDNGIITAIALEMKDLRNKNVSKVNLKNTEGLETIILYRNEQGGLGITSVGTSSETSTRSTMSTRTSTTTSGDTLKVNTRTSLEAQEKALEMQQAALERQKAALERQRMLLEEQQAKLEIQQQEMNKAMLEQEEIMEKSPAINVNTSGRETSNNKIPDNVLYIVDGKEITKEEMENINPENIESINVLKDAESIKEYGEKAKDGVVIITLKKEN